MIFGCLKLLELSQKKKMGDLVSDNLKSANIELIQRIIPHRYPFLLVDKVIDIDGLKSATGIKNVTFNEPHFQGHFPNFPVMPGVTKSRP